VTQFDGRLTLVTVHGAGHEVPTYNPQAALELFKVRTHRQKNKQRERGGRERERCTLAWSRNGPCLRGIDDRCPWCVRLTLMVPGSRRRPRWTVAAEGPDLDICSMACDTCCGVLIRAADGVVVIGFSAAVSSSLARGGCRGS
jgi:hypothetical protein